MTKICRNNTCNRKLSADDPNDYCKHHIPAGSIRRRLKATSEKRVVLAGITEECANGTHMARQVSLPREPWL